jgi:outer membrane protein assembly factor BamE (lipoprotein component of BamABCDE complex)
MHVRRTLVAVLLAGLVLSTVSGCGSKVNQSNFDKVKTGMTRAEVEDILGKPTEESGGAAAIPGISVSGKIATWKDGDKVITVTFANEKVVTKGSQGL